MSLNGPNAKLFPPPEFWWALIQYRLDLLRPFLISLLYGFDPDLAGHPTLVFLPYPVSQVLEGRTGTPIQGHTNCPTIMIDSTAPSLLGVETEFGLDSP